VELADSAVLVPSADELEAAVLAIWQGVLEQPLGVESDFFALGGDSILSIQLTTRLRDAGHACTVKEVFEARTVRRLCRVLGQPRERVAIRAEQGVLAGEAFALQPIQQWFFEQPFATPQHWNQGVVLRLPANIAVAQLMDFMRQLLRHHDALRLAVDADGQRYLAHLPLSEPARLDAAMLGEDGLQQALTELQADMQPAQGRHLAWALIDNLAGDARGLFIAVHHLAIDAVSWRILVDDLRRLAHGEALPVKTSSYRQWGEGLAAYACRAEAQLPYWRAELAGMPEAPPAGWAGIGVPREQKLELSEALTRRLQEATRHFAVDLRELLLAALTRALHGLGLGERQWIMLEGHGREAIDPALDVSRTVGWFTSMFPLALRDQANWPQLLRHAAEQLRRVPDKGVGYLPLRAKPDFRPQLPLPAVALNYLGVYQSGTDAWQALPIAPGRPSAADNPSAELISLHGGVFDGRLTLRQIGCLRAELNDQLLALLQDNLLELAEQTEDCHACA